MDSRRSIPPYIVLDFGNKGLLGLQCPVEYGGLDLTNSECMEVFAQLGATDLNLAILVGLHNCLGIRPIMYFSTPAIRNELLPKLASGRELAAFALTEPGAGSNVSAIEGQAIEMPDGSIKLNGTKMWIGNASWAGVINVFLRYVDKNGKPHGSCGYVVRQEDIGLEMGPELMTMGLRGMVQNILSMKDLTVSATNQLGEIGRGIDVAQDAMMHTRLTLGSIFLGAMKRSLQLMHKYAVKRKNIVTGALINNPISLIRFNELTIKCSLLESLLCLISSNLDNKTHVPEEFLIVAKVSGSEFLWDAVDSAMQMLGGRGYLENNEIARIFRDARVGRIFEGPTETMMYHMGSSFVVDNQKLVKFLDFNLNAKDISISILEAQQRILSDKKSAFDASSLNSPQLLQLAYSTIGEIVYWGVLYSVAKYFDSLELGKNTNATQWAQEKFTEVMQASQFYYCAKNKILSSSQVNDVIENYSSQIGNHEQTLPGEEWSIDALIRM